MYKKFKTSKIQDINPIYQNNFGIAFQWKRNIVKDLLKVQIVFRDTGLLLSKEELTQFSENIKYTKENGSLCGECLKNESCKALLVESPAKQISFTMNAKELAAIEDLVKGTLFQMNLDNYLGRIIND